MVVLDVISTDVEASQGTTFSLDTALERFAPHYGQFAGIDSMYAYNGWKERVKLMSKTYKYNSNFVQTIKCNFIPSPEDRGYEALSGVMKVAQDGKVADVLAPTTENLDIEERKIEYLQKFIDVCKANNIGLVVSYSPYCG